MRAAAEPSVRAVAEPVVHTAVAPIAPAAPAAEVAEPAARADGEARYDALSVGDFEYEATEALLLTEPELTSRQILEIRKRLLRIAQGHGWVDR